MSTLPANLTESQAALVELNDGQAEALGALGKRLAGKSEWWGASRTTTAQTSALSLARTATVGHWSLRVNEAIGLLSVGGQTIPVLPKIPLSHALELIGLGGALPRNDGQAAWSAEGTDLFDMLARWFVRSVQGVLRRDLIRDYRAVRDELPHVRGRISLKDTTLAVTRGRALVTCEFDELDRDNALNRVLLAGLHLVARAPFSSADVRAQARKAAARFDEVSSLRPGDMRVLITPATAYYSNSLDLARTLLNGAARHLDVGGEVAWAFLLRTPEAIEAGVRAVLQVGLQPDVEVEKRGIALLPSTKTLNPDLVFSTGAIGDVKYKLHGNDWNTADLYQAVAFATGFRARQAAVIDFSAASTAHPSLRVGDVIVTNLSWPASPALSADEASAVLVSSVREWLLGCDGGG